MFLLQHYAQTGQVATYDEIKATVGIRTDGEVSRIVKSLRGRVGLAGRRNKPRETAKSHGEITVINGCPK